MKYRLITFLLITLLISCKKAPKPTPESMPTPTPESMPTPTPESTPTPTPESTPTPTPLVRTPSAGDKVYVVKKFNLEIEDGIVGFPIGKPVTILQIENDVFIVSDGKNKASKPADFFATDPTEIPKTPFLIPPSPNPPCKLPNLQSYANDLENTLTNREKFLVTLNRDLQKLEYRIRQAGDERVEKGFPRDGGSRIYKTGKIVSLGTDASKIKELINNKYNLEARIEHTKNEIKLIERQIDNIHREIQRLQNL